MVTYALLLLLRPLAERLPRAVLDTLARLVGTMAFYLAPGARRAVEQNLAVVRPDLAPADRAALARHVFIHGALGYVEMTGIQRVRVEEIIAAYPATGIERYEAAIAAGRGVILVGAHVGPISIGGQLLVGHGAPATVIVEALRPPALLRFIIGLRQQFGLQMIPLGPNTGIDVIRRLRRGEVVGMTIDRDVAGTGVIVPFFGKPTRMTTAAAVLARRTGATVVACAVFRNGLWSGHAVFDGPIEVPHTSDGEADVREGTARIIAQVEAYVRTYPEQWVVFSPIWGDEKDQTGPAMPSASGTIRPESP